MGRRPQIPVEPPRMQAVPAPLDHRDVDERHREHLLVTVGVAVGHHLILLGQRPPRFLVEIPDGVGHPYLEAFLGEGQRHQRGREVFPAMVERARVTVVAFDGVCGEARIERLARLVLRVLLQLLTRHVRQVLRHPGVLVDAEVQPPSGPVVVVVSLLGPPVARVADVPDLPLGAVDQLLHRLRARHIVLGLLLLLLRHLLEPPHHGLIRGALRIVGAHHPEVVAAVHVIQELVALAEVARVLQRGAIRAKPMCLGVEPLQSRVVQVALVPRPLDEALREEAVVAFHRRAHPPRRVVPVDDERERRPAGVLARVPRQAEVERERGLRHSLVVLDDEHSRPLRQRQRERQSRLRPAQRRPRVDRAHPDARRAVVRIPVHAPAGDALLLLRVRVPGPALGIQRQREPHSHRTVLTGGIPHHALHSYALLVALQGRLQLQPGLRQTSPHGHSIAGCLCLRLDRQVDALAHLRDGEVVQPQRAR